MNIEIEKFRKIIKENFSDEILEKKCYDHTIEILNNQNLSLNINNFMIIYKPLFIKLYYNVNCNDTKTTREELNPEKWNKLREKRTNLSKIIKKQGAIKCPKCDSIYTEYVVIQIRSADEPATIKVSCECGNKWKE